MRLLKATINTKMAPPLRSKKHVEAVLEAIKDGTTMLSQPIVPRTTPMKNLEYDNAPFGITGLETAVGLAFESLFVGIIDLVKLVEMFSSNPAKIFSLEGLEH